jgi:hypothetical protein
MTAAVDPGRVASAETLFGALLDAKRIGGDGAVCDALDMLGAGAGQGRYRRAAAAIRSLPPGRAAIDDELVLERILKFPPHRRRGAVGTVVRDMAREMPNSDATRKYIHATKCRLRRKLNEKQTTIL